ncbi:precorrin-6y C5,15-methyltransferase (decarboxylating) subunit CbiE [Paludicola sp. MB14-C6]|uniref:precorrin-6y C5,15-methyltransferase (decarboxylating) subunit CbiE n=1 Tax=Paludihabitans sp. MB14-C6 TaxID=3070656 RepID=UPI0027DC16C1|nr:precorrin-6y C5,15-methyltransferase (decarboxylating) subunit CbiE [Paludicola sp. MB14-C6]WMJ22042.1 precorrin-6y C5,15-methyltransferase (decarboxylating) subunit CbiE [Paludicola sp. MB14-C6]
MKIYVIGAGLGKAELISQNSLNIIQNSDMVITTDRLHEKFKSLNQNSISLPLSQIPQKIKENGSLKKIAILASGDIGFYSISSMLKEALSDFELEFISGTSSLQYLTAKMQIPYDNVKTVSVHGRERSVIPFVCYNERVFVLTGGKYKAHDVINELINAGLGNVFVTLGENLSDSNERIISDKACNLKDIMFDNLCVMLIENLNYHNANQVLRDSDFVRAKVPMTKEEIRNLSLSKLAINKSDIVYDIGAGTGSVSIAMAYKACEGFVYAIEKEQDAVELIGVNKAKLGAFNLIEKNAKAPEGIDELPTPNKVFIGGSSGNLDQIFDSVLSKNKNVRIVVNAITLETLNEAVNCFQKRSIEADIICVNVSKSETIGSYHMMKAQNPVYIISGESDE